MKHRSEPGSSQRLQRQVNSLLLVAGLSLVGCGSSGSPMADAGADVPMAMDANDAAVASDVPLPGDASLYRPAQLRRVAVREGYVVMDRARSRSIPIKVRFPMDASGPLPLILFSHGGGPNPNGQNSYSEWATVFAAAGYAVINMAHVEDTYNAHCAPLGIPASECEPGDFQSEVSEGGTLAVLWYNRPRDVSAILDDLPAIEAMAGITIDRNRMGMAGHSGGSNTVMSLAGARLDVSPSVHNLLSADARLRAFLALSPQGIGRLGLTATSWDNISVPMMIQTGLADTTAGEQAAARLDPFMHLRGPDQYQLYLNSQGATHEVFGLGVEMGMNALELLCASSAVAFFDAYLQGNMAAREWLRSRSIDAVSNGVATITAR